MRDRERGWTGGQQSLVRVIVALAGVVGIAAWHAHPAAADRALAALAGRGGAPSPSPGSPSALVVGIAAGLMALAPLALVGLALGAARRVVIPWALLAALWAALGGVTAPLGPVALFFALALLLMLPAAPALSWPARGRSDPRGDWCWPRAATPAARLFVLLIDAALVFNLAVGPSSPMVLLAGRIGPEPSAARRALGELAWVLSGSTSFEHWLAIGLAWLPSVLALHLFALSPRWFAKKDPGPEPLLLFDGECALCHGTVRLLLAEDTAGTIAVAPLQGETAAARLSPEQRAALPDSLVLLTADGRLRTRSDAVLALLAACGGLWRPLAALLRLVPRPLRDLAYAAVAAVRRRIFGRATGACPLLPPDLAARLRP